MKRIIISNVALVGVLLIGLAYVLFSVIRLDPTKTMNTVDVNLASTGGLLERADVTYLGVPIGRVESIGLRQDGVRARITMDSDYQVPMDTEVVVAGLSAAGEQHLDMRPRSTGGPYITDGVLIDQRDTKTPRPFAELLAHIGSISDQLEPEKLGIVVDELAAATDGSAPDVRRLLTGGRFLLSGLEDVLPETVSLLENGHTTLTTVADLGDELQRLGKAGKTVAAALQRSDQDIRELLDSSPKTLQLFTDVIKETGPTLGAITGDMSRVTKIIGERLPAWSTYLPELTNLGNGLPVVAHDGALNVLGDLWARPMCDYGTPRRSPAIGGSPDPHLNGYCTTYADDLQQRGAYYAPRPAGDDTAGPAARTSDQTKGQAAQKPAATKTKARAGPTTGPAAWYEHYLGLMLREW